MYTSSGVDKIKMMLEIHVDNKTYDSVIFISKVVSLMVYTFFTGKLLFNQKKESLSKNMKHNEVRWKKIIYRIHVAYVVSYLLYGISVFGALGTISSFIYHLQMGAMSAIVIYIAYMAYVQPSIFKNEFVCSVIIIGEIDSNFQ